MTDLGRPSEVTLQALANVEHAERGDADEPSSDAAMDPWRDEPNRPTASQP